MSQCKKTFSMTPTLDQLLYFKFDSFYTRYTINSACNLDETNLHTANPATLIDPAVIIPGVIGNAFLMDSDYIGPNTDGPSIISVMPAPSGLGNKNFTVRFWIRCGLGAAFDVMTIGVASRLIINCDPAGTITAENHTDVPWPNPDYSLSVTSPTPASGTWFRVVVTFTIITAISNVLTIRVDNGTKYIASGGLHNPIENGPGYVRLVGYHPAKYDIDELYIEPGYAWTDAEAEYDWNGGLGRTWPDVPQTFTHFYD